MTTHEVIAEELAKKIRFILKDEENITGVRPITVTKNNRKEEIGLAVKMADTPVEMIVHLPGYIPRVIRGSLSMNDCAEEMVSVIRENMKNEEYKNLVPPMEWDYWKERIIFCVINRKENEEMLKKIPHIPFLDLAVIFRLVIEPGYATAVITNTVMDRFDIRLVDLIRAAESQYAEKNNFGFEPMDEILADYRAETENPKNENVIREAENLMWVLSNREKEFGAGLIADRAAMEKVGEILDDDYYILPSSIHELIVLKASCSGVPERYMVDIVKQVNRTAVLEKDWLSDHVYYYSRKQKKVSLVEV